MDNILLIFLNELENIDKFNNIIDKFAENNYSMYLLDNIKKDETFSMDLLPGFVEFYKSQHESVNKVVVLSNSRDLVFSWYRCYNSLVDDFIYFVDKDDKNYFQPNDRHFDFYYNLYEFNGIDQETVNGKIYLSEFNTILLPIYYDLKYFDKFMNYKFMEKDFKQNVNKLYKKNGLEYNFISEVLWKVKKIEIGKMDKRIVFIKGKSQYDVLRIITDYKVDFFKEIGFEVDVLDLLEDGSDIITNKLIEQKTDFVYSNNCIGIDIKLNDGRNLYEALCLPFYGMLVDHPVNQLNRIINSPVTTQFSCMDKENIDYFDKYFRDRSIVFEPRMGVLSNNYKEIEYAKRKNDILFVGSLIEPSEIEKSLSTMDKIYLEIIKQIVELATKCDTLVDIDDEITKKFNDYMILNRNNDHRAYIHSCIEKYIRNYRRYELIKKLSDSGLSVTCIGEPEKYKRFNILGNFNIKDKVSFQELLDIFNDTKIVISSTGQLYNGVSERVLSAMINGAVVMKEDDNFARSTFINGENIILYNSNELDEAIENIKYYLANIHILESISKKGQELSYYNYDYRISQLNIYRMMREIKFKCNI